MVNNEKITVPNNGVILSLGAPNDAAGNLSTMALDRLNAAISIYRYNPGMQIMCTGGKGAHFNETEHPHYYYSYRYLQQQGIPETAFAPAVYSTNTMEDFVHSREQLYALAPPALVVVTSDFHIKRAKIIHDRTVNYPHTLFWGAASTVPAAVLEQLVAHERQAVEKLMQVIQAE